MEMVANKPTNLPTLGCSPGQLLLKVRGTTREGQILRLTAPKCTIGSAEGCTLRLHVAGVSGVECLVLRGALGTAVRSWGSGARLNGRTFGDATLMVGDRLGIGPIELEVAALHAEPDLEPTPQPTAQVPASTTSPMD